MELLLQNLVKADFIAGPNTRTFPEVLPLVSYKIGPVTISNLQLIALAVTVILCLVLQFIVNKTQTGRAMRATAYDRDAAALMGININKVISLTFALGSALACNCWSTSWYALS